MVYTKKQFKEEWEKEDCKLTYEDCADCARDWRLCRNPKCAHILHVRYWVLKAAQCSDAEEYNPFTEDDEQTKSIG